MANKMLTQALTKIAIAGSRCSCNQNHDHTRRNLEISMSSIYRLWNAHLILLKRSKKPPHIQMVHMIYSILYTSIHVWPCKLASFWCLTAMHRFPIASTYGPVPNLHVAVQRSPNSKGVACPHRTYSQWCGAEEGWNRQFWVLELG